MLNNGDFGFPYCATPAFSTPAVWCRVFQSRVFHPCSLVPRFPVPRFPVPRFQSPRSCVKLKPFPRLTSGGLLIQQGIARFQSNFVQTLITWRLMYYELSRSTGQMSRSQLDITYQHQRYNSGSWRFVSRLASRWNSWMMMMMVKLSKVKLGENYPRAERNT